MTEFESGWPTSFNKTLTKNVTMMTSAKKSIKLEGKPVYDTELIYTRVICLQQYRDIDITDVLSYELSPVPASLFDESGAMRDQSKAVLKTKLQVEQSSRTVGFREYRMLSSSMDVPCCGQCIGPQVAPFRTTWSISWGASSITWNAVTCTWYLTGTSQTVQSR